MSPDCPEAATGPKSQWNYKTAPQHLCTESQLALQSIKGTQRGAGSEDDNQTSSTISLWTNSTNSFIRGRYFNFLTTQVNMNSVKKEEDSKQEDLQENILLDSGSSIDLFSNLKLVTNITRSKQSLFLSTNVGSKVNKTQVKVPDYGTVWFDKDSIANIFPLTNLIKKYRVTFDSEQENTFVVYTSRGQMKFSGNKQGLYVFKPEYKTGETHLV